MKLIVEKPYITKDEMATITGLNASTIMRNIEKMRSTYLRRVGSNKFWEIIKYYNTITSPTKYLVWLGLFCIGLFQFLLHQLSAFCFSC